MHRLWAILLVLIPMFGSAQSERESRTEKPQIIDEVSVSGNYTIFHDSNTESRFGFGAGVYRSFFRDKRVALTVGFEFYQESFYKKSIYESHLSHSEKVTYHLNYLSIPISARLQFGQKTRFFIETGAFMDLFVAGRAKGTHYSYLPDENNQLVYTEQKFNNKRRAPSVNVGLSGGLGLKIPIKQVELVIRPEYRYGFIGLDNGYDGKTVNQYVRLSLGISWRKQK